jgi:hypothetical protein
MKVDLTKSDQHIDDPSGKGADPEANPEKDESGPIARYRREETSIQSDRGYEKQNCREACHDQQNNVGIHN